MKGTIATLLALAGASLAAPQSPSTPAPAGCSPNYPGTFSITTQNVTRSAKRDLETRQDGSLSITLSNGVLKDSQGRTGCIVANRQFQFDGPPQAGTIYASGWSVCQNGSLAIGGNAIFYQCLSGNFYNLYDQSQGNQCNRVYLLVTGSGSGGAASAASDGQPQAATSTRVSQISDGQVQATTATRVSQISDGQIQATTGTARVSQISDGQIQATTAASSARVSQISDGQIQATTGTARVSQISDGQIQATTGTARVSQISDGQIQATTGTARVSQISDGQVQAATSTRAIATFTGAAVPRELTGGFAFVAGLVGAVAML